MNHLSIIIITYNEAQNIRACLESVKFADEIIVLDSGSQDDTCAIAKEYTSKVYTLDWPGDGPQRNRGIECATGEWILCLDADEKITPLLTAEILSAIQQPQYDGYSLPFLSHYLGKPIHFGDWRNERHARLFRRTKGRYSGSEVYGAQGAHSRPVVQGPVGRLHHPVLHYPFQTVEKVLSKMNQYSSGGAALKKANGQKSSVSKAVGHGLWAFLRGYFFRLGFLDGREGFLLAVSNAEGSYYRYIKLWNLNN